jgi:hypothetical protein
VGILVPTGDIEALASAFVAAHRNRQGLAEQTARGLAVARMLTLDGCHRQRAEIARACLEDSRVCR